MKIWIDADSCPRQVRDLVCKTGTRLRIEINFVANRQIQIPESELFHMIESDNTPDAADDYIVENSQRDDLVITRDIPLAKRLVDRGGRVLNDRGNVYTENNINERLSMRNLMLELFNSGIYPVKTDQYGKKEIQEFANALDRELTKLNKSKKYDTCYR